MKGHRALAAFPRAESRLAAFRRYATAPSLVVAELGF